MLNYIHQLPTDIIKKHVLSHIFLTELIQLERAACSKVSRIAFLQLLKHFPPVVLKDYFRSSLPVLQCLIVGNAKLTQSLWKTKI